MPNHITNAHLNYKGGHFFFDDNYMTRIFTLLGLVLFSSSCVYETVYLPQPTNHWGDKVKRHKVGKVKILKKEKKLIWVHGTEKDTVSYVPKNTDDFCVSFERGGKQYLLYKHRGRLELNTNKDSH
ncbi:MAG: hypothetical protein GY827_00570 [Cytophagales bacterium]|nr:hypothetical protein [Cytophagales bacterium]